MKILVTTAVVPHKCYNPGMRHERFQKSKKDRLPLLNLVPCTPRLYGGVHHACTAGVYPVFTVPSAPTLPAEARDRRCSRSIFCLTRNPSVLEKFIAVTLVFSTKIVTVHLGETMYG